MRIVFVMIFVVGSVFANSFVDAITSGEKEGDIHLLFDYTSSSPDLNGTKYQNSAFLATSFGLYYHSAFYGYFRAHIGFRGAIPLIQGSRKSSFQGGRGDAARDFWDANKAMLARSYLEYFDGDTSIRLGRLEDETDALTNHFDGLWVQNKSLGFLLIDFIWINQQGTVLPRELSGFEKLDTKYGGAYYLGATLDLLSFLKLKLYGALTPQLYSFVGFKVALDVSHATASAGILTGFEHKNSPFRNKTSLLFNADIGYKYNIFYAKLGYVRTGSSVGMGSLQVTGNSVTPFFYFSGDALNFARNVNLFYGKLGIDANVIQAYLVYGYNTFNKNQYRGVYNDLWYSAYGYNTLNNNLSADNKKYSQGELNLYFDWKTSDATNVIFYLLNTHGGKAAIPNLTQTGIAFRLGF